MAICARLMSLLPACGKLRLSARKAWLGLGLGLGLALSANRSMREASG